MSANYSFELRDDDGAGLADIEVTVNYRIEGEGEFTFDAILMERTRKRRLEEEGFGPVKLGTVNLLTTDEPLLKLLGTYILAQVEADTEWQRDQLEEDGWVYYGRGSNDPDGCLRRVA